MPTETEKKIAALAKYLEVSPDSKPSLKMRKYKIEIVIVPTALEVAMFGATMRRETREIEGYTFEDAKRRNNIA